LNIANEKCIQNIVKLVLTINPLQLVVF